MGLHNLNWFAFSMSAKSKPLTELVRLSHWPGSPGSVSNVATWQIDVAFCNGKWLSAVRSTFGILISCSRLLICRIARHLYLGGKFWDDGFLKPRFSRRFYMNFHRWREPIIVKVVSSCVKASHCCSEGELWLAVVLEVSDKLSANLVQTVLFE